MCIMLYFGWKTEMWPVRGNILEEFYHWRTISSLNLGISLCILVGDFSVTRNVWIETTSPS